MPEQLTKHPDITLGLLKDLGAQCGTGAPQNILKACPPERFCALPSGELCIYGLEGMLQMTQITKEEMAAIVCPECQQSGPVNSAMISGPGSILMGAVFIVGIMFGKLWKTSRAKGGRPPR